MVVILALALDFSKSSHAAANVTFMQNMAVVTPRKRNNTMTGWFCILRLTDRKKMEYILSPPIVNAGRSENQPLHPSFCARSISYRVYTLRCKQYHNGKEIEQKTEEKLKNHDMNNLLYKLSACRPGTPLFVPTETAIPCHGYGRDICWENHRG